MSISNNGNPYTTGASIYIYIYIERERERQRDRDRQTTQHVIVLFLYKVRQNRLLDLKLPPFLLKVSQWEVCL